MENWDDNFEVETRINSPQKAVLSTPRLIDKRDGNWDEDSDEELESEGKCDELDLGDHSAEFGFFAAPRMRRTGPYRQVAACGAFSTSLFKFFASSTHAILLLQTTSVSRTFSRTFPRIHSHLHPTSTFALLPPSPPIHKEWERRRRKKSRPPAKGKFELKDIQGVELYSFSDCEAPGNIPTPRSAMRDRNGRSATPMSDMSSVDERHHHHVFEPTPPLPTQPSTLATAFPITIAPALRLNITSLQTPTTPPTKGGTTLLSRIGGVKKWGARRRRGTSSTPPEIIGGSFFL